MRLSILVIPVVVLGAPVLAQAGDGAIQLTFDPAWEDYPAWSHDGTQILFSSSSGYGYVGSVPATGGSTTQIPVLGVDLPSQPTWSPDDSQIAFNAGGEIMVVSAFGGPARQLTFLGSGFDCNGRAGNPDWGEGPYGSWIAFWGFGRPMFNYWNGVCVIPETGDSLFCGPPVVEQADSPSWSPDGSQIALHSTWSGNSDIWVIPAFGGTATQITFDAAADFAPSWSNNGRIAFTSDRGGNRDIWVIPATGGTAAQITLDPAADTNPCWSPDGSQIAFASDRSGNGAIWVIDVAPPIRVEPKSWGAIKGKYHD